MQIIEVCGNWQAFLYWLSLCAFQGQYDMLLTCCFTVLVFTVDFLFVCPQTYLHDITNILIN